MPKLPLVLAFAIAQAVIARPEPPTAKEIAPDTFLVPGAMLPDRGPDGNTVLISTPAGLIVIDTGRHAWHSDGILEFARARRQSIAAIVNTHWHLDHSSGNRRIKASHPAAKLYTTTAIDRALAPDGFLTRNAAAARTRPADPKAPPTRQEETEIFLATMDASESLRPDEPIERSGTMRIAGRPLSVHVTKGAVTDADVWLYDEATGVATLGDLVTLPAPFFETACPARWQEALDEVWASPFRLAVPGHGAVMTRGQFNTYRKAFGAFRACVAGDGAPATCAEAWSKDVGPLMSDTERKQAPEYAAYYVEFLRKGGGNSPDCQAK